MEYFSLQYMEQKKNEELIKHYIEQDNTINLCLSENYFTEACGLKYK